MAAQPPKLNISQRQLDESQSVPAIEVFRTEWDEIRVRRQKQFYVEAKGEAAQQRQRPPENMVGLALSGGGIRSATFCLGLLQGMHKLNLLRIFDYVSTVSGGGYVGGWWSAWLSREHVTARVRYERPFFTKADLRAHPMSLVMKIRDSQDEMSKQLRVQYRADDRYGLSRQIAAYKTSETPSEELLDTLVKELNRLLLKPPCAGAPVFNPQEAKISAFECLVQLSEPRVLPCRLNAPDVVPAPHAYVRVAPAQVYLQEHKYSQDTLLQIVRLAALYPGRYRGVLAAPVHKSLLTTPDIWRNRLFDIWRNRMYVENEYAYELKDIFPQREMIEPTRPRSHNHYEPEVEGASSAWVDPIHHLRLFANYLTPRRGALSADTWRAISVILRNLILTWLILLPVLISVLLPGQILVRTFNALVHPSAPPAQSAANTNAQSAASESAPTSESKTSQQTSQQTQQTQQRINDALKSPLELKCGLMYIGLFVSFFIGWLVLSTILWLLTIRDTSTRHSLVINLVCLGVIGGLLCAAFKAFNWQGLFSGAVLSATLAGGCIWLAVALLLVGYTYRPVRVRHVLHGYPDLKRRWKREVRRNRISRTHTRLLVWMTLSSVVLLLAVFTIVSFTSTGIAFTYKLGLLPVLPAIAGSIFTAFQSTPIGGGEKRSQREPSRIARLIFAITPALVMLVLALGASWIGNRLLWSMLNQESFESEGTMLLISAVIYYGIVLCFALVIYEMNYPSDLQLTWPLIAFVCLLIITASLIFHAMLRLLAQFPQYEWWLRVGLVLWPTLVMGVVLILSLTRVFGKVSWKSWLKIRRLRVLIIFLLIFVPVILRLWTWAGKISSQALIPMVGIATLAGSLILFRLAVVRREGNRRQFELWVVKGQAIGQRPEALWLLASLCLMLPVVAMSFIHEVVVHLAHFNARRILMSIGLVIGIGLLPYALALFGSSVAETRLSGGGPQAPPNLLGVTVKHLPWLSRRTGAVLALLACVAILAVSTCGFLTHPVTIQTPVPWARTAGPVFFATLFASNAVCLLLFKSAVTQLPVGYYRQLCRLKPLSRLRWGQPLSGFALWGLAGLCLIIAFFIGYAVKESALHTSEYVESLKPSTYATLAGMAGCFTLMVFEIGWGRGQNRRSLWLLAFAYLTLLLIFGISLIPENAEYANLYAYARSLLIMGGAVATVLVWLVALGWMVDPNGVSMHHFYKSRLVRAYLGASNPRRLNQGKEITEAVAGDDIPLNLLRNCQRGAPYHLINTTLNLVAGRDLATAQRSAASFVLSAKFCGSMRTRYRPTAQYMGGEMSLGTAVAASGAAVSPSMGAKRPTAALAMLMTMLNVRLGFWAPTPNRENWQSPQPRLWPFYLLREFLSQTNDLSSYCYLTDGGHFDNTGLYSLVERGCRYIVISDCGADPQPCFQDLGDAIRRCRIDFGTEIKLNIEPFVKSDDKGPTRYFVVGGVRYSREHAQSLGWEPQGKENSREDKDARTGTIIYFKPSVLNPFGTGKETADVRQYAIENSFFPQQGTANQWFDEAQFESYRRLGQLTAKEAFENIRILTEDEQGGSDQGEQIGNIAKLSPKLIEDFFKMLYENNKT